MCTAESHAMIYEYSTWREPRLIGCICGQVAADLRALDEIARCEAWLAVPWHEPTRWP